MSELKEKYEPFFRNSWIGGNDIGMDEDVEMYLVPKCMLDDLTELEYENDGLTALVEEIVKWSKAYPVKAFPELSNDEWLKVTWGLAEAGVKIDRVSASNMRHVIDVLMQYIPKNHTAVEK